MEVREQRREWLFLVDLVIFWYDSTKPGATPTATSKALSDGCVLSGNNDVNILV